MDVHCTLLIQKTAWIVGEDTVWPCETTGGEPPVPPSGKGYVYAGAYTSHCDEYDSVLNVWTSKTELGSSYRWDLAASTIGNSGYVYGGYSGACEDDCDEYTPDVWVSKSNMPAPARSYLAASTI